MAVEMDVTGLVSKPTGAELYEDIIGKTNDELLAMVKDTGKKLQPNPEKMKEAYKASEKKPKQSPAPSEQIPFPEVKGPSFPAPVAPSTAYAVCENCGCDSVIDGACVIC